jgi:hypothetical protein
MRLCSHLGQTALSAIDILRQSNNATVIREKKIFG